MEAVIAWRVAVGGAGPGYGKTSRGRRGLCGYDSVPCGACMSSGALRVAACGRG